MRVSVISLAAIAACLIFGLKANAHVGTGIDLDRQGRIYFTDTYHNCIWRLETNGKLTPVLSGVHLDYLIVGEDGYVYLIKDGIWKINPQGEMTEVLSSTQFPEGGRPLCIDRQANIYFVNPNVALKRVTEIYRRTAEGKVTVIAGGEEPQQDVQAVQALFRHINSAVCTPDGSLYLRDDQYIRRVSPDGAVSTLAHSEDAAMAEGGQDSLVRTMGMVVDIAGNVYVANYWKRAVMKVTTDGKVSTMATSRWPWVPVGVAVSGNNIYVLERMGNPYGPSTILEVSTLADRLGSPRVRKVSPDGSITTLIVVKGERSLTVIVVPLLALAVALLVWLVRRRRAKRVLVHRPDLPGKLGQ
jgi:sugar lactone lactonase YvrE